MFLRADRFDAASAAKRMANYFTSKWEVFGPDKLVTKLTLQDLSEEDIRAMEYSYVLPEKDKAGRPIWIFFPKHYKIHWKNHVRNNNLRGL